MAVRMTVQKVLLSSFLVDSHTDGYTDGYTDGHTASAVGTTDVDRAVQQHFD